MAQTVWRWLLLLAAAPPAAVCLLTPTANWWFAGELACNAGLHAALLLLPALLVWRRSARVAPLLIGIILLGAWPAFAAAWEKRAPLPAPDTAAIPVACANLYLYNREEDRPAAVAAALAERPRIVVLAETIASSDRREVPLTEYPYQVWQPQLHRKFRDCVALLSTYPISDSQAHDLETQPFISATLDVDGRPLHVIAVHTTSPVSIGHTLDRDLQLVHIAQVVDDLARSGTAPVLLLGDCNLAVNSSVWQRFHADSGLLRFAGSEPATWPSWFGGAGITIDHVLARGLALGPQQAFTIPGSDHRGLRGTIAWP